MFISNGIDIVNINREEFNNSNLPIKILSKIELEEFNKINDTNERKHFLATRWSIKEAILKCLEKLLPLPSISIIKQNNKYVWLNSIFKCSISTSNEDQYIIASVIVYQE